MMYVTEPDPKTRIVHDFEITCVNGHSVSFTIDKEAGDEMVADLSLGVLVINMSAKMSPDGNFRFPAETITLTQAHVVSIKRTERTVSDPTAAQKEFWKLTTQEIHRTVQ